MISLIKDDYSAKISEQFTSLLKEIKNLRSLKFEKLELIDNCFKKFIGISSNFVNKISDEDLLQLLEKNNKLQGNLCAICAALLYEEGNLYIDTNSSEAYSRYLKGFIVILNIFTENIECEIEGYYETAFKLASKLEELKLLPKEEEMLYKFYKSTGKYSKAEDYLYYLYDNSFVEKNQIIDFYEELLSKNDNELIDGNLSREEILSAINEL